MLEISKKAKKPLHRKGHKIAIGILVFLLLVFFAGVWYWDNYKEKIIREKIIAAINKKSNGLYHATIEDLKIRRIGNTVTITNMVILYDSLKYAALVNTHTAPSTLMKITFPRIVLTGLKTPLRKLKYRLEAKKLQVFDPNIELISTHEKKDTLSHDLAKKLYKQILGNMDLIHFDAVSFSGANFRSIDLRDREEDLAINSMNLNLVDIHIDSLSGDDSTRILFARKIAIGSENISWYSSTRYYQYIFKGVSFNTNDNDLAIGELHIKPQLSETDFASAMHYQSDRLDVDLGQVMIKDLRTAQVMKEAIWAESLDIKTTSVKLYRDIGLPRMPDKIAALNISEQLMQIPLPIMFKTATFPNLSISYRERNDKTRQVGDVRFDNSSLAIQNLTNMPSELASNNICRIDASTTAVNLIPVRLALVLPLGSVDGRFFIEGRTAAGLDLVRLNDMLGPMGLTRIKSGHMNSLHFKFNGNNSGLNGSVTGLYDNLKIDFLEVGEDHKINKRHFGSLLRGFFIKDDNPHKKDPVRVAQVNYPRDKSRSFYNLIWKSIMNGITTTITAGKGMKGS
ncbi:MAG TPA: hypothetical protein VLJ68_02365 [Chitinophagaceae bacterium]|nr:hypothetical protein [Chitinophagaceae bacterium]